MAELTMMFPDDVTAKLYAEDYQRRKDDLIAHKNYIGKSNRKIQYYKGI